MEFQTLIENRRSVRKYSSHTNVTKEQIQQLVQVALEAPSWKNTETGRYYCVLSEDMSQKLRKECLCYAKNDVKTEHAALIVTTFVHNRGLGDVYKRQPSYITVPVSRQTALRIMRLEMDGAVMTLVFRMKT